MINNKCNKCGSGNITRMERYNLKRRGTQIRIVCRDCGYMKDGWTDY